MTTSVTYRGSDAASVYMFCLYLSITFTPLHVSSLPIHEEGWPKLHSHFLGHPCLLRLRGGRNIFSFDPSTRYYELLGLRKMELPSEATIKKAYHKMALKWHPDRAPAEKKAEAEKEFKDLKEAYDTLIDPQKRYIYDTQGEAGLKSRGRQEEEDDKEHEEGRSAPRRSWSRSPHDLPTAWERYVGSMPFSLRGVPPGARHPYTLRREAERNLHLTLEELFHGGNRMETTSVFRIDERSGWALPSDKTFSIPVKPGWKDGTKVTFADPEGLQDLVFVVREQRHALFRRRGDDLIYTCHLSLKDVRSGVNVTIPTISDNQVQLHIRPNSPMLLNTKTKVIPNEGMPIRASKSSGAPTGGRGNLVIKFVVRGFFRRRIVAPALAASRAALKVGSVAGVTVLLLRHPLQTLEILWTLSTRLALLVGLLVLYI